MVDVNRFAWMVIFLVGAAVFVGLGWQEGGQSAMGWFLFTSIWSAFCGISYTVLHWVIENRSNRRSQ